MVAIDDDWSVLRFRHIDKIKSFTREKKRAMSEKGKQLIFGAKIISSLNYISFFRWHPGTIFLI